MRFRLVLIFCAGIPFLGLALWELVVHPELAPEPFIALIAAVCVAMLLVGRRAAAQWNDAAVVYYAGLAYCTGKKILIFEWDQITAITVDVVGMSRAQVPVGTVRSYVITHRNGKQLKVDKMIVGYEELCNQVREKTFPHMMANDRQAFQYGKLVKFGAVAMGKEQGILVGKDSLRWRDIGQISVERRQVVVKPKRGLKLKAMSAEIPYVLNLDVCLALAEEMTAEYG